jgi:hypothetical protein
MSYKELKLMAIALSERELLALPLGELQSVAQILGTSGRGDRDELLPRIKVMQKRWRD